MARSNAKTPAAFLKKLPADRRRELSRVRAVVRKHLPDGYRETMNWGMITYEVQRDRYANTYNGQPVRRLPQCRWIDTWRTSHQSTAGASR